jgi:hypothetical protein
MGTGLPQLYQELVQVDGLDSDRAPMRIQRISGKFAPSGKQGQKAEKAKVMNKANARTDLDALMEDEPQSEAEDDSEAERERASLPLIAFAIY